MNEIMNNFFHILLPIEKRTQIGLPLPNKTFNVALKYEIVLETNIHNFPMTQTMFPLRNAHELYIYLLKKNLSLHL
jgi:hypothetical protein